MELSKMRRNIDRIDAEIIQLLTRRLEVAVRTKRFKSEITDPEREEAVLAQVRERSGGLFGEEFATNLFKLIMNESKRLQGASLPLTAFPGEHGSYGEVALKGYNKEWIGIPCRETSEIFDSVLSGGVDYGIVPIENSTEGSENTVHDLLVESSLYIVGEIRVPVRHCLLVLKEQDYREVKNVYAHESALSQCRGFVHRNKLEAKPYYDSAGAALMLLRERPPAAAVIGTSLAARLYNLEVLKEDIQDGVTSATRYVLLSKAPNKERGNKCSITFTTAHRAGALLEILGLFSKAGLNLTRIESRPRRNEPSQVAFLLDFMGSETDSRVQETLTQVQKATASFRLLGCYAEHLPA